jgi:acyl-CoA synthetase (AMP-forming)/AMP-acid ligase II
VKVYGEKNLLLGDIVVADILSDSNDAGILKSKIREHCIKLLDDHKVPVRINILEEVPMTVRLKNANA